MRAAARLLVVFLIAALPGSAAALRLPRAPRCVVFPRSSPWNQRIDKLPVATNSGALIRSIGLGGLLIPTVSVIAAITLLPAMFGLLGHRINSVRVMPKQMMPSLLLHWEATRGHEDGIREAVLLAKGFGMTKAETVNPVCWAMLYGAHGCISNVERAAGDVFERDDW